MAGKGYYYVDGTPPQVPEPGKRPAPWGKTSLIGTPRPRVDAYERVSGAAVYPSDARLPGMLYAAVVRCPHPHARALTIDVSGAAAVPGVRAVLTGADPEADIAWDYDGKVSTRLLDPHCRFEGEPVAALAADNPYQAADAARAVKIEWEVLPFVHDERHALDKGAPEVHPGGNLVEEESSSRGDLDKGFAQADVVVEMEFRTACELHTPIERHGCLAAWDGDALTVHESTQGVFAVRERLAAALGLPQSKVRVIGHYVGGGFGSKLRAGRYSVLAALLARKAGKPVRLFLEREETFLSTGNRPASNMRVKLGARKDGTLTAIDFEVLGTGGAYPAGGTALVDWLVRDLYLCPRVRTRARDVYVNAGPARPFRAPGHPQGAWALEQAMDELAGRLGLDPVALRLKNVPSVSQAREGQPPYTSTGLAECIRRGAEVFGWDAARREAEAWNAGNPHLKRGAGMAACLWIVGGGGPPSTVLLSVFPDGSAQLVMGASDIGTGTKTVMALVAAEELGLDPDLVRVEHADTGTTPYATPSGGSKTVPTEAPAVRAAAVDVKTQLRTWAASQLGVPAAELTFTGTAFAWAKDPAKAVAVTELKELKRQGVAIGMGIRQPNPEGKAVCPFAAQFCEVEVDTASGEIRVLRFVAVHESGRVMDRLTFDSQVIGGVAMGIGLALTEERVLDPATGKLLTKNWHDYKLPTMADAAGHTTSVPLDRPDAEANTSGAKGLGEPVTIPTAAAIGNAIRHALGVRLTETPVTPARVMTALSAALSADGKEA